MQPFTISNTQYTNSQLYTITPGPGIFQIEAVGYISHTITPGPGIFQIAAVSYISAYHYT